MIEKKYVKFFKELGEEADRHKIKVWLVGGAVRDFYLGRKTQDVDITVEGDSKVLIDFLIKFHGAEAQEFDDFGTARVKLKNGLKLDFVRARKEVYLKPAALPKVSPSTIDKDLFRRDFTANAWALSINGATFGVYYDPFKAKQSIDKKQIKVLHDKSFIDDPTRAYRAVRFAGRFNWTIEKNTKWLLKNASKAALPSLLSRERLRAELIKILEEKEIRKIFKFLQEYDLNNFIFPKLKWHNSLTKTKNVNVRLGILACSLGAQGGDFIESLHLPRALSQELYGAWEVVNSSMAPLKELTGTQLEIIKKFNPKFCKAALTAVFITGGKIAEQGFNGKEITSVFNELRRAQFKGAVKNKNAALKFIKNKKHISNVI
ncbi:tRNA nucleotidyltransferase/poly(A) polymerase [Elusimicrobium minutum Pei191]|uniref:tRNA nucleotidyltransferase/poly(A) polymerase n=1 Tax=Elusimicrobium minutum (strain Pei191) TaxID=445932 RepID=B2KC70_ELUMP|nr:CCA tRNA nucleotidyltransferase [Elusimicrobium minutum]ACC98197.1 tRNA nucleotidyltransferase/poly(A) polymerase [Elusimicrobium minutum Pei191]